jgi:DNA-binding CsgD family transcriptional regulator
MQFTNRESQVLEMILEEKTSKEIGEVLKISKRTVEVYRNNLIHKVGAKNTVGLVKFALLNMN